MTTTPFARSARQGRTIALLATGVALAGVLVGCGDDTTDTAEPAAGQSDAPQGDGAQRGMPGTSGQIADVEGDVLQVRSQMSGQVAVTVADDTAITDQAAATLADVTTGVCVVVRSGSTDQDATPTAVTAASVSISPAGEGGCAAAAGPGGGGPGSGGPGATGERPSGMPTDRPSGMPTDMPSGGPGGGGRPGGRGVGGEVTSVSDTGFVVTGTDGEVSVTVGDDTSYSQQVAATATALEVGRCVRVDGDADDAGAVTATSIQVSDAVDDQCGR